MRRSRPIIILSVVVLAIVGLVWWGLHTVRLRVMDAYSVIQLESVRGALLQYQEQFGGMPGAVMDGGAWHEVMARGWLLNPEMLRPPRANGQCVVCVGYVEGLSATILQERGIDPATQLWLYELPECVNGATLAVVTFDGRARLESRAEVVAWIERVQNAAK